MPCRAKIRLTPFLKSRAKSIHSTSRQTLLVPVYLAVVPSARRSRCSGYQAFRVCQEVKRHDSDEQAPEMLAHDFGERDRTGFNPSFVTVKWQVPRNHCSACWFSG